MLQCQTRSGKKAKKKQYVLNVGTKTIFHFSDLRSLHWKTKRDGKLPKPAIMFLIIKFCVRVLYLNEECSFL